MRPVYFLGRKNLLPTGELHLISDSLTPNRYKIPLRRNGAGNFLFGKIMIFVENGNEKEI
jgi:hypothetical protein